MIYNNSNYTPYETGNYLILRCYEDEMMFIFYLDLTLCGYVGSASANGSIYDNNTP